VLPQPFLERLPDRLAARKLAGARRSVGAQEERAAVFVVFPPPDPAVDFGRARGVGVVHECDAAVAERDAVACHVTRR